jgi:hypothetical protein
VNACKTGTIRWSILSKSVTELVSFFQASSRSYERV